MLVTYPPGSWSSGEDGRFMAHAGHEFAYALWRIFAAGKERDVHRNGVRLPSPGAGAASLGRRPAQRKS